MKLRVKTSSLPLLRCSVQRCSLRPSLKIIAVSASSEIADRAASALVQRCSLAVAPSAPASSSPAFPQGFSL
nr:hypothetical protein CFP56_23431 [Quercus suber]